MKDRIKQIMDNEQLGSARFADMLQINRAVISHILNGRNNPSLDVVTKILSEFDYINPEWLLNGNGDMYKEGFQIKKTKQEPDLFSQRVINADEIPTEPKKEIVEVVKQAEKPTQQSVNKEIRSEIIDDKKITQIIVYYSNGTFEVFKGN